MTHDPVTQAQIAVLESQAREEMAVYDPVIDRMVADVRRHTADNDGSAVLGWSMLTATLFNQTSHNPQWLAGLAAAAAARLAGLELRS